MPGYHVYLISSLPMLHFGAKPPFSFKKFMETCQDKIPDGDLNIIALAEDGYVYEGTQATLKKWRAFEAALRNELVKIRASRKHIDPLKYTRGDEYIEPYIAHIAMNTYRTLSILEAEKFLDQQRWRALDELAVGHYFDLDFLIVYAIKLLILERWERVSSQDGPRLLEGALN